MEDAIEQIEFDLSLFEDEDKFDDPAVLGGWIVKVSDGLGFLIEEHHFAICDYNSDSEAIKAAASCYTKFIKERSCVTIEQDWI